MLPLSCERGLNTLIVIVMVTVCVCVCVCVCVRACVCVYVACVHSCLYACACVRMCAYVYIYVSERLLVYMYVYVCKRVRVCVCVSVCARAYNPVRIFIPIAVASTTQRIHALVELVSQWMRHPSGGNRCFAHVYFVQKTESSQPHSARFSRT